MTYTYDASEGNRRELAPGVILRTMWGEKTMISRGEIAANAVVPMHSHPHDQAGMVLAGAFAFTIGGETTTLKEDDYYIIPGGVAHGLVANDQPSVALDIFSPPREDYMG